MRACLEARLVRLVGAVALTAAACGGGQSAPDGSSQDVATSDVATSDVAAPGMCGADVPAGQECNTLTNLGPTITPICSKETAPVGTGGVIADGTYALTAQTMYDASCSSPLPVSETIVIAGDCLQLVFGSLLPGTASGRLTTQGSTIALTPSCTHIDVDGAVTIQPFAMQTYTATSTTFTLFDVKSTGATVVTVYTKR